LGSGLVVSLARPGGNVTGMSLMAPDLGGKRLELLKEILPRRGVDRGRNGHGHFDPWCSDWLIFQPNLPYAPARVTPGRRMGTLHNALPPAPASDQRAPSMVNPTFNVT
jgi:hypothetical protein